MTSTANSRNQADQGANAQRRRLAIAHDEPVVEEVVGVVPQAQALRRRGWSSRRRSSGNARRTWSRCPDRRRLPAPARWRCAACSGCTSPSRTSRRTAPACRRPAAARTGRRRRYCPCRGSRPRRRCRPRGSLRFTHQVKLSSSLVKTRSRNLRSPLPVAPLLRLVKAQRRPGLHGRIDVAEVPFVGGQLPVRVHVPGLAEQDQLMLGVLQIEIGRASPDERPSPRPRTRETPICPASRRRLPWWHEPTRCCVRLWRALGGLGCAGSPSSHSVTS